MTMKRSTARDLAGDVRPEDVFAGGGEMGALMRVTDWSKTRLGPVEQWPRSLKTMLGVVLGSRFPMLLWWGRDLLHLYNDAYRPILRDKHPASLAAPAAEVWAEVWDVAGPLARSVQDGGPATWMEDLQLFINSGAMAEETYFTFSYSPVPGDDGKLGGILNTVQETTAKVQSERQLRMLHDLSARAADARSEEHAYRLVLDSLSENQLDLPFLLVYAVDKHAQCARLIGARGLHEYEGLARAPDVPIAGDPTHGWPFAEVLRTGRESVVENLSARFGELPVGGWGGRPEKAMILPLSQAGRTEPYALLVLGVSPHRVLDERYQQLLRATAAQVMAVLATARAHESETKRAQALSDLDQAKTAFFSNVSHEFRTPLTLMLGPLEDCMADPESQLPPEQRARLELVHHNALRLLKLVNALLDFSRIEAGRMQATFVPTDLGTLTAQLASAFHSAAEKAGLRLSIECPPCTEPAYVDRELWEKVVLNLVSNAFKFTLQGEIAVCLSERSDRFELVVADSGTGIPEQELPHLFERFHRVRNERARTHEGTGIGLSLVQELVKLHAGAVGVQSRVDAGTTFTVSIPKGKSHLPHDAIREASDGAARIEREAFQQEALRALERASPSSGRSERAPEEAARPRVLLVDDNADLRTYIQGLLSPRYEIEAVTDGVEALEAARSRLPDLVLSDVMMPRLDGFGLLRELRADPRTRSVPIILLSARAGEESAVEGLDAGADDYLVKPFSARELLARVRTHLDLARDRRAWAADLERINRELEAFSYSVSHDLRAPLRAIDGFSKALLLDCTDALDESSRHYLERIRSGTERMARLIEDLFALSQIQRSAIYVERVDLARVAAEVVRELRQRDPDRKVVVEIARDLSAHGDKHLLTIVLENLLGNAWKFTSKAREAKIAIGREDMPEGPTFFVRDNGAGFDMAYADKLFAPFQRLHRATDFEGTGIGLATVQRIVSRHGGRIFASAAPNQGATFHFTLGRDQTEAAT
jgi:signal transduction histidine kinase